MSVWYGSMHDTSMCSSLQAWLTMHNKQHVSCFCQQSFNCKPHNFRIRRYVVLYKYESNTKKSAVGNEKQICAPYPILAVQLRTPIPVVFIFHSKSQSQLYMRAYKPDILLALVALWLHWRELEVAIFKLHEVMLLVTNGAPSRCWP